MGTMGPMGMGIAGLVSWERLDELKLHIFPFTTHR